MNRQERNPKGFIEVSSLLMKDRCAFGIERKRELATTALSA